MKQLEAMLAAHPHPAGSHREAALACIEACAECAAVCSSCADACLAETNVMQMVRCIRLNLDCADICEVTGRLFARPSERDADTLGHQLEACIASCRACAEECERHQHMEHCRICAEVCRRCVAACEAMRGALVG